MKKKKRIGIAMAGVALLLSACGEKPSDAVMVNEILEEQPYIQVSLGEAYHQEQVAFDQKNGKAVIANEAAWGRPSYREGEKAGVYYGEEDGGETYDTDEEVSPELYLDSYLDSVRNLNLSVEKIKKEEYVIQVVKSGELELFEQELNALTSVIMNDYELTGVELEFDKQCRLIRKTFRLREKEEEELKKEQAESEAYVQEFSYKIKQSKFERDLKKVKKEIGA